MQSISKITTTSHKKYINNSRTKPDKSQNQIANARRKTQTQIQIQNQIQIEPRLALAIKEIERHPT